MTAVTTTEATTRRLTGEERRTQLLGVAAMLFAKRGYRSTTMDDVAEAAGVTGILLPEDRAAAVTPAVVRASAGASEHLRVARTVNLVRAMKALQEAGLWLAGLDMGDDARLYTEIDFQGRMGIVVGAEGQGLGRLVRESCDFVARIPMCGQVASLNAGGAGGIMLFEAVRQRAAVRL